MSKKEVSYHFQNTLLSNLIKEFERMKNDENNVVIAKKILVQMRYFMTTYKFDDDVLERMSLLIDQILDTINLGYSMEQSSKTNYNTVFTN